MGFTVPVSLMEKMRLKEFKTVNHPGSCENADPGSVGLGWAGDAAFPTSSQEMPVLLVPGQCLEYQEI